MFYSIIRELVPEEGTEEDVFKGMHLHMVRMTIAALAASPLTYAVADADELDICGRDPRRNACGYSGKGRRRASPNLALKDAAISLEWFRLVGEPMTLQFPRSTRARAREVPVITTSRGCLRRLTATRRQGQDRWRRLARVASGKLGAA
jgi:hypothetical protein